MTIARQLGRLLDAVLAVTSDLELEATLGRVVDAACALVGAKYGALGVIDTEGEGLSAFVHRGVDEATAQAIGHLPEGRGVLGLLIREPEPVRLENIADHPASYGFPPHHPPMRSFLGTPIRVRGEFFGNLYLSEKIEGGPFTEDDEELVVGLAAVAGVAIANARLYADLRQRELWRDAVLEVATSVLAGDDLQEGQARVVALARHLVDADGACLVVSEDDGLQVLASVGEAAPPGFYSTDGSFARDAIDTARPVRAATAGKLLRGPGLWVPLHDRGQVVGALGVSRGEELASSEVQLLAGFAAQATLALAHERAQADLQRLSVIEERERIGRDLHDTVIQRLFATGLSLQSLVRRLDDRPDLAERLHHAVDDIDQTVREIRSTIFALQATEQTNGGLRARVLEVVDEVAPLLNRAPRVRFEGPLDTVVDLRTTDQILPVVREALTNVARHARADDVEIEVALTDEGLELLVRDDGVGLGGRERDGFGLRNLEDRARARGGGFEVGSGPGGRGTQIRWWIPV